MVTNNYDIDAVLQNGIPVSKSLFRNYLKKRDFFANITDLAEHDGLTGAIVYVAGLKNMGDGWGGHYRWSEGSEVDGDGFNVVEADGGRWFRIPDGVYRATATGDGLTNDAPALQKDMDFCAANNKTLIIPRTTGFYRLAGSGIVLPSNLTVQWETGAWCKPTTQSNTGAWFSNGPNSGGNDRQKSNITLRNPQIWGDLLDFNKVQDNAIAMAGGYRFADNVFRFVSDIVIDGGEIRDFWTTFDVRGPGGKGIGFEEGVRNVYVRGTTCYDCSYPFFVSPTYYDPNKYMQNVVFDNVTAIRCGLLFFALGEDYRTGEYPDTDSRMTSVKFNGTGYSIGHFCSAKRFIVDPVSGLPLNGSQSSTPGMKGAAICVIAISNITVEATIKNPKNYPSVEAPAGGTLFRTSYPPYSSGRITGGLDGPVGSVLLGNARNSKFDITAEGEFDDLIRTQVPASHGGYRPFNALRPLGGWNMDVNLTHNGVAKTAFRTGQSAISAKTSQGIVPGTTNTIKLHAQASSRTGEYIGFVITIISGTGAGQSRNIIAYNGTTKVATVYSDWDVVSDNTSVFNVGSSRDALGTKDYTEISLTGTVQAVGGYGAHAILPVGANATDDHYTGTIAITGGTGSGQTRNIIAYFGGFRRVEVDAIWTVVPDNTSTFSITAQSYTGTLASAANMLPYVVLPHDVRLERADDYFNGKTVTITAGTGAGQVRTVSDYQKIMPATFVPTVSERRLYVNTPFDSAQAVLPGGASAVDDFYNNLTIVITGGKGAGQSKVITDFKGSTRLLSFGSTWDILPDNTSTFTIGAYSGTLVSAANTVPDATSVLLINDSSYVVSALLGSNVNYLLLPFDARLEHADGYFDGKTITVSDGWGKDQVRTITKYVNILATDFTDDDIENPIVSQRRAYVNADWDKLPNSSSKLSINDSGYTVAPISADNGEAWVKLPLGASTLNNKYIGSTLVLTGGTGAELLMNGANQPRNPDIAYDANFYAIGFLRYANNMGFQRRSIVQYVGGTYRRLYTKKSNPDGGRSFDSKPSTDTTFKIVNSLYNQVSGTWNIKAGKLTEGKLIHESVDTEYANLVISVVNGDSDNVAGVGGRVTGTAGQIRDRHNYFPPDASHVDLTTSGGTVAVAALPNEASAMPYISDLKPFEMVKDGLNLKIPHFDMVNSGQLYTLPDYDETLTDGKFYQILFDPITNDYVTEMGTSDIDFLAPGVEADMGLIYDAAKVMIALIWCYSGRLYYCQRKLLSSPTKRQIQRRNFMYGFADHKAKYFISDDDAPFNGMVRDDISGGLRVYFQWIQLTFLMQIPEARQPALEAFLKTVDLLLCSWWKASGVYVLGQHIVAKGMIWRCIDAGTAGASHSFSGSYSLGDQVTDGGVIWSAVGTAPMAQPVARSTPYKLGTGTHQGGFMWVCTTEGTTAGSAPTYTGHSLLDTVTDGTAVFTADRADVPAQAITAEARDWYFLDLRYLVIAYRSFTFGSGAQIYFGGLVWTATTSGTTSATDPFTGGPYAKDDTVVDGGVTWRADIALSAPWGVAGEDSTDSYAALMYYVLHAYIKNSGDESILSVATKQHKGSGGGYYTLKEICDLVNNKNTTFQIFNALTRTFQFNVTPSSEYYEVSFCADNCEAEKGQEFLAEICRIAGDSAGEAAARNLAAYLTAGIGGLKFGDYYKSDAGRPTSGIYAMHPGKFYSDCFAQIALFAAGVPAPWQYKKTALDWMAVGNWHMSQRTLSPFLFFVAMCVMHGNLDRGIAQEAVNAWIDLYVYPDGEVVDTGWGATNAAAFLYLTA